MSAFEPLPRESLFTYLHVLELCSFHNFYRLTSKSSRVILHLFCEETAVVTRNVVVAVDHVEVVVAVLKGAAAALNSCCTSSDASERLFFEIQFQDWWEILDFL